MATLLSSSDSAPLSSVMICWNTVAITLKCCSGTTDYIRRCLISPTVAGRPVQLRVTVCCCLAPPRRIALGWCGWKRTPFPLQSWAHSAIFSFASLPWRICNLNSTRDEVPFRPRPCSCSVSVSMLYCPFPDVPCGGDRPHITYNGEIACSQPRYGRNVDQCVSLYPA
jgi:hypothetical protein